MDGLRFVQTVTVSRVSKKPVSLRSALYMYTFLNLATPNLHALQFEQQLAGHVPGEAVLVDALRRHHCSLGRILRD